MLKHQFLLAAIVLFANSIFAEEKIGFQVETPTINNMDNSYNAAEPVCLKIKYFTPKQGYTYSLKLKYKRAGEPETCFSLKYNGSIKPDGTISFWYTDLLGQVGTTQYYQNLGKEFDIQIIGNRNHCNDSAVAHC